LLIKSALAEAASVLTFQTAEDEDEALIYQTAEDDDDFLDPPKSAKERLPPT